MSSAAVERAFSPVEAGVLVDIPPHIPSELVFDFDYLTPSVEGTVHDWWAQLHDAPDIFWTPRHKGHWVMTRHEDIGYAFETFSSFSNEGMTIPMEARPFVLPPASYDPPLHTDFRNLIMPFFSPKSIAELEGRARALSIELIEGVKPNGGCEFTEELALQMPIGVFMAMVELPVEDQPYLLQCADEMVRGTDDRGFVKAAAYLSKVFEERRANPGNDMLSAIATGTVQGGRLLSTDELIGMGVELLAGGLDTVAAMMGFVMQHLAEHPADRQRLIDEPTKVSHAIEELMRRYSLVAIGRLVTSDMEYKGVAFKAGDLVLLPTPLAGLDSRQFADPLKVDFDRKDRRSLIFGRGPHQCAGQFLARTELRLFVAEWLRRIPEFSIAPGDRASAVPGRVNFVRRLPLVWPV